MRSNEQARLEREKARHWQKTIRRLSRAFGDARLREADPRPRNGYYNPNFYENKKHGDQNDRRPTQ
jgi:hypothetical protein